MEPVAVGAAPPSPTSLILPAPPAAAPGAARGAAPAAAAACGGGAGGNECVVCLGALLLPADKAGAGAVAGGDASGRSSGGTAAGLPCACAVCTDCLSTHFEVRVREGLVESLPCPSCWQDVGQATLARIATPNLFSRYKRLALQAAENKRVRNDPNLTWCPTPDCNTIVERRAPDRKTTSCCKCEREFCFLCLAEPHKRMSCDEAKRARTKASDLQHELAFQQWAKKVTKTCPSCKTTIERDRDNGEDCNHMICGVCHTEFCWLCGSKVPPIGHFDDNNVRGCPGLQYSGPDVSFAKRTGARARALGLRTASGLKKGAIYGGIGLLAAAALPVVVVGAIPYFSYRGVKRRRARRAAEAGAAVDDEMDAIALEMELMRRYQQQQQQQQQQDEEEQQRRGSSSGSAGSDGPRPVPAAAADVGGSAGDHSDHGSDGSDGDTASDDDGGDDRSSSSSSSSDGSSESASDSEEAGDVAGDRAVQAPPADSGLAAAQRRRAELAALSTLDLDLFEVAAASSGHNSAPASRSDSATTSVSVSDNDEPS